MHPVGPKRRWLVAVVASLCIKGLRLVTVQLPVKQVQAHHHCPDIYQEGRKVGEGRDQQPLPDHGRCGPHPAWEGAAVEQDVAGGNKEQANKQACAMEDVLCDVSNACQRLRIRAVAGTIKE
jgi:hypothetical protein